MCFSGHTSNGTYCQCPGELCNICINDGSDPGWGVTHSAEWMAAHHPGWINVNGYLININELSCVALAITIFVVVLIIFFVVYKCKKGDED